MRLLPIIRDQGNMVHRGSVVGVGLWQSRVSTGEMHDFLRRLQEAWDWLVTHGLISSADPSQGSRAAEYTFVTRCGLSELGERPDRV